MKNVAAIQAQIAVSNAYVTLFHARIVSGAYKTRTVHKGGYGGPLMTEDELLQDEIGIMENHIRRMNELTSLLYDENHD